MFYLHERIYIIVDTWWQQWWSLLYYFLIKLHRCFLVSMQHSPLLRVNRSQTLHQRCDDNLSDNWANINSAKVIHCILCNLSSAYHYLDTTIQRRFHWVDSNVGFSRLLEILWDQITGFKVQCVTRTGTSSKPGWRIPNIVTSFVVPVVVFFRNFNSIVLTRNRI